MRHEFLLDIARLLCITSSGLLLSFLVVACGGDAEQQPPVATATPSSAATVVGNVLSTPVSMLPGLGPPSVPGALQVPATLWLIDAEDGSLTTLREDRETYTFAAEFAEKAGVVVLHYPDYDLHVSLDGKQAEKVARERPCRPFEGGAEVLGRAFIGVSCGLLSPDGRRMTYRDPPNVGRGPDGRPGTWDQWVVDLRTGERRLLQAGLQHCGGCDGRIGSQWSASGRYVFFAEYAGEYRVFLSDVYSGTTRVLSTGKGDLTYTPDWSPRADVLLRHSERGTAILDAATIGESRDLGLPWPARFDRSGAYLYGWASAVDTAIGDETTVADARTGATLARLHGRPSDDHLWWWVLAPVAARGGSFVAALEEADGCPGTAIYVGSEQMMKCVEGGVGATVSPGGSWVASARKVGVTGPASSP